jgi:DNA-binding response OmpR family regulator
VLDVQLPGIDGMSLLSIIRESTDTRLPRVPAVFLTNSDEPALRARSAQLGATEYLLKHDTPPRLLATVLDRVVADADSGPHVEVVQTSELSWCIRARLQLHEDAPVAPLATQSK